MQYDILFLGGGPAGYEGAVAAARNGLKTAVVEMGKPGGTCLHWGCIPTKAILSSLKILKMAKSASKLGIRMEEPTPDPVAIPKNRTRVVSRPHKGIEHLFKTHGVDHLIGRGTVTGPHSVRVGGHGEVTARNIVLATGSVPAELPFLKRDGKLVLNSDDALKLETVPERLLVVGAGAIGLEMGLIYRYLGSKVTVVEIMPQVVPGSETELADILAGELKKQGLTLHLGTTLTDPVVDAEKGEVRVSLKTGDKTREETYDRVLLAVGRRPYTEGAFESSVGITLGKRGFVEVNERLQTAVPSIFACGDVIGEPLLAHKASHEAIAIAEWLAHGRPVVHRPVPGAVFTWPELASVGLTEAQAREQGHEVTVGRFAYAAGSRSNAVGEIAGMVKVVGDGEHRLLGAHVVGAEAGELMPLLTWGVTQRMKAEAFKEMIFIHPTLSENVLEALGSLGGFAIHG